MKKANLIDVFNPPFEVWTRRKLSIMEASEHFASTGYMSTHIKDKLINRVRSAREAGHRLAMMISDSEMESFIDEALENSPEYNALRKLMPEITPPGLHDYQARYANHDREAVDSEIEAFGALLEEGQYLFHGGHWSEGEKTLTTVRPLSTSFCPQIARRNAEWSGKAYDAGRLDITLLKVTSPKTKVFLFGPDGEHGHEKEVLFASGAKLECISEKQFMSTTAYKAGKNSSIMLKEIPIYFIEAKIT